MVHDIAFAASARAWPDRVHRFVLDHGGARVVGRVLSRDQIDSLASEVLLIDDVCSFLTPHLVHHLKRSGVEVVGVYSPEDGSHAKRRLLECGISDVIEADATPAEFLAIVESTLKHRVIAIEDVERAPSLHTIGVTSAVAGVGGTEVSIGLAMQLSSRAGAVLIDFDQHWPSVAQRLALPVHPNIRTVIDGVTHQSGRAESGLIEVGKLRVIGGRADVNQGAPIGKAELMTLLLWLADSTRAVIVDLGPLSQVPAGVAREFSSLVVVGSPDPVGLGRLSQLVDSLLGAHQSVVAVLNNVRGGAFRRSESLGELARLHPTLPVVTLPFDQRVSSAAWDGVDVHRGRFARGLESMVDLIERSIQ